MLIETSLAVHPDFANKYIIPNKFKLKLELKSQDGGLSGISGKSMVVKPKLEALDLGLRELLYRKGDSSQMWLGESDHNFTNGKSRGVSLSTGSRTFKPDGLFFVSYVVKAYNKHRNATVSTGRFIQSLTTGAYKTIAPANGSQGGFLIKMPEGIVWSFENSSFSNGGDPASYLRGDSDGNPWLTGCTGEVICGANGSIRGNTNGGQEFFGVVSYTSYNSTLLSDMLLNLK